MGRGTSGSKGGAGGGGGIEKKEVIGQDGTVIDLSETPLIYDGDDISVSGELRKALEEQEGKRSKAKIEYALLTDAEGNPIMNELKGGKGSCKIPEYQLDKADVLTHNHPRGDSESGALGGTFSEADLMLFSHAHNMKTIRASAAEGTYSMSKAAGFDGHQFRGYVRNVVKARQAELKAARKKLDHDVTWGDLKLGEYKTKYKTAFNQFLVGLHNDLRAGQSTYGYRYTLEGGGK